MSEGAVPNAQQQYERNLKALQDMGFSYNDSEIALIYHPTLEAALAYLTPDLHIDDSENSGFALHFYLESDAKIDECSHCGRPRARHMHDFVPAEQLNPEVESVCALCQRSAAAHTSLLSMTTTSIISDGEHRIEVEPPELVLSRQLSNQQNISDEDLPRPLAIIRQASLSREHSFSLTRPRSLDSSPRIDPAVRIMKPETELLPNAVESNEPPASPPVPPVVEMKVEEMANSHVPSEDDIEREKLLQNKRAFNDGEGELCVICMDEFHPLDMVTLPCSHKFCFFCCRGYFHTQIRDGKVKELVKCPDLTCRVAIKPEAIQPLVSEPMWLKYLQFARNHEVRINPLARFCPRPGCDNILYGRKQEKRLACEKCNYVMCFECNNEYHGNTDCNRHLDRLVDEWAVGKDVQPCPQCRTPIEKTEGCNHMSCSCGYQFCWLCRGRYYDGHFLELNPFGCPGQQFSDYRPNFLLRMLIRLVWFIIGTLLLSLALIGITLAFTSIVIFWIFYLLCRVCVLPFQCSNCCCDDPARCYEWMDDAPCYNFYGICVDDD
eukprot:TRINITY_DN6758_c0_g1_i1.p1 TRINITY_DN6758_c0_g1~~TRINITY_DN6758_c0_g1_i1.p1  ORF type:complete len:550 (-),score=-20.03 TRINITY_DN6758_c0_g1_i1:24-1673(-)